MRILPIERWEKIWFVCSCWRHFCWKCDLEQQLLSIPRQSLSNEFTQYCWQHRVSIIVETSKEVQEVIKLLGRHHKTIIIWRVCVRGASLWQDTMWNGQANVAAILKVVSVTFLNLSDLPQKCTLFPSHRVKSVWSLKESSDRIEFNDQSVWTVVVQVKRQELSFLVFYVISITQKSVPNNCLCLVEILFYDKTLLKKLQIMQILRNFRFTFILYKIKLNSFNNVNAYYQK